jgi:hypothetical protein
MEKKVKSLRFAIDFNPGINPGIFVFKERQKIIS